MRKIKSNKAVAYTILRHFAVVRFVSHSFRHLPVASGRHKTWR